MSQVRKGVDKFGPANLLLQLNGPETGLYKIIIAVTIIIIPMSVRKWIKQHVKIPTGDKSSVRGVESSRRLPQIQPENLGTGQISSRSGSSTKKYNDDDVVIAYVSSALVFTLLTRTMVACLG